MKPRNDRERMFCALAGKLPPISKAQREYALDRFIPEGLVRRRRREIKCLHCGNIESNIGKDTMDYYIDADWYWCPECGKEMGLKEWMRNAPLKEEKFFTVVTTFHGYQVARTFLAARYNTNTNRPTCYSVKEVFQNWLDDEGRETITGLRYSRSAFTGVVWDMSSSYDIKHHNGSATGCFAYDDLFDLSGNYFYPDVRVSDMVKRNGWNGQLSRMVGRHGVSPIETMRLILTDPLAEMLAKAGQVELLSYMARGHVDNIKANSRSIRIASRHGYIVDDATLWLDYVKMLSDLGLDTHNPHYICPEDLSSAHDSILRRHQRWERARMRKDETERLAEAEKDYKDSKGRYFGICISSDSLEIRPIRSVPEMREEGREMHHCVYQMKYYGKPDSLILSARDKQGHRIETVELDIKNFKVIQSRGVCNTFTSRHDEIINLINQNINKFKKIPS